MDIERHGSILIVDDDPSILETTSELLKAYEFPTLTSGSAPDALQKIQQHKVDVVLSDIVMPGHSGIELLMDIYEADPALPVILMTGYADLEKAVDAIQKHAFDFIIKPYMPEQLVMSVERALKYAGLMEMERNYKSLLEEFAHELEGLVTERTMSLMAMTVADRVRNPASVIGLKCAQALKHEGLPLVRQIVYEHMGEINIASVPEQGTTFSLSFPERWLQGGPQALLPCDACG